MSSRESTDLSSQSGVIYQAGQGATLKNVKISKHDAASRLSKLATSAANPIEVHADNAVWDTVLNKFLFPGRDYSPGDLQRK